MRRNSTILAVARPRPRRVRRPREPGDGHRRLLERLRRAESALAALGEIARTANSILEPAPVTEIVARRIRDSAGAALALVYRLGEDNRTLRPSPVFIGSRSRACAFTLRVGQGMAGIVFQQRRILRAGPRELEKVAGEEFDRHLGLRTRSYLGAPLLSRGRLIGVLELRNRRGGGPFGPAELRAVRDLVEPAAIAIDNACLFQRSQELSVTDDLTKLYNSRFLADALAREVKRSRRYGAQLSVIFLDLDGFKKVNDKHGHLIGSRTLIEVGQVLREAVREIDVVARYGGDEFTIILPQTDPDGAHVIAERIRQAIADHVYMQKDGLDVRLTASLGVASFPTPFSTPEELIRGSDQAMYRVKDRGRDGVGVGQ